MHNFFKSYELSVTIMVLVITYLEFFIVGAFNCSDDFATSLNFGL